MRALQAVEAKVKRVLSERAATLQSWRKQIPTKGNRVKNFENWLLLELMILVNQGDAKPADFTRARAITQLHENH